MSTIMDVRAREIIDSRGNPTVEADVTLASGGKPVEGYRVLQLPPASSEISVIASVSGGSGAQPT